ncbi:MAG: hypothetical protein ACR2J9_06520, partial [Gaiellales bacterium]
PPRPPMRRRGWLFVSFGGMHLLLGLGLFGFVAWMMLGKDEDDVEESDGGGGGGSSLRPRPWRPGPGRPRGRRGPVRVLDATRSRQPATRVVRTPR